MEKGLVHLYFGDGKGKTTCAFGLALRAAGSGMPVVIAQFLKDAPSGELAALEQLPGVQLLRSDVGGKFSWDMDQAEQAAARQNQQALLNKAFAAAPGEEAGLLVLDEALGAAGCGLLPADLLEQAVRSKPPRLELVLTGRGPSQALLALADYATEMKMHKHPFTQGIPARKGIEF